MKLSGYGYIKLQIGKIMDERGFSINDMSKKIGVKYDVIKCYYYGTNYSYNLDTLAKICYVLQCDIKDIMKYIPENRN